MLRNTDKIPSVVVTSPKFTLMATLIILQVMYDKTTKFPELKNDSEHIYSQMYANIKKKKYFPIHYRYNTDYLKQIFELRQGKGVYLL